MTSLTLNIYFALVAPVFHVRMQSSFVSMKKVRRKKVLPTELASIFRFMLCFFVVLELLNRVKFALAFLTLIRHINIVCRLERGFFSVFVEMRGQVLVRMNRLSANVANEFSSSVLLVKMMPGRISCRKRHGAESAFVTADLSHPSPMEYRAHIPVVINFDKWRIRFMLQSVLPLLYRQTNDFVAFDAQKRTSFVNAFDV